MVKRATASADKPTLGDLVRTVIIKAGRPLKRLEIQAGLKSSTTPIPRAIRIRRLESACTGCNPAEWSVSATAALM